MVLLTLTGVQVFLREAQSACGRPLRALLILPVQRLPRYSLLLQTVLKVYRRFPDVSNREIKTCNCALLMSS